MSNKFSNKTQVNLRPKVCKSPPPLPHPETPPPGPPPVTTCANWNPAPAQVRIVVAGFVNGTCSRCGNLNGTHVLDYNGGCEWIKSNAPLLAPCVGIPSFWRFILTANQCRLITIFSLSVDRLWMRAVYSSDLVTPIICTLQGAVGTQCGGFPPTITVTPVT